MKLVLFIFAIVLLMGCEENPANSFIDTDELRVIYGYQITFDSTSITVIDTCNINATERHLLLFHHKYTYPLSLIHIPDGKTVTVPWQPSQVYFTNIIGKSN